MTKKSHKEGITLDKDKKRDCIQKFLNFLYQMKEKANNDGKEKEYDVKDQKLYTLTNKIIRDLEILSDLYEH